MEASRTSVPWRRWLRAPWLTVAFASVAPPTRPSARERILEMVCESPGITVGEVRARIHIGWGSFYHHLDLLKRERAIEALAVGRRSLLYPAGFDKSQAAQRALLRGPTVRKIAATIRDHPGSSIRDIIRETGESPRVAYHHVRRLAELDLVTSTSRTRHLDISATALLVELLALEKKKEEGRAAPRT